MDLLERFKRAGEILFSSEDEESRDEILLRDMARVRHLAEFRAAVHEAGHAVVAWRSPYVVSIQMITIDNAGVGCGQVQYTLSHAGGGSPQGNWDRVAISLAGMAGELVEFGKLKSGGSKQDLLNARAAAYALINNYKDPIWKKEVADTDIDMGRSFRRVDPRVRKILNLGFARAKYICEQEKVRIAHIVTLASQNGPLGAKDIREVFGKRPFHF